MEELMMFLTFYDPLSNLSLRLILEFSNKQQQVVYVAAKVLIQYKTAYKKMVEEGGTETFGTCVSI